MLKQKKLKTPLYGTEFTVIMYDNVDELKTKFKDYNFEPSVDNFDGGVFEKDNDLFIVFLLENKSSPKAGVIAHEAKHLVNKIFIDICCELDRYNDEPECYILGWIVDKIHEFKNQILTKITNK